MLNKIEEAILDIQNWKMVIVVDSEDRENEWDLVMSWELVKDSDINFMIKEARWLVCTPISYEISQKLSFPPMQTLNCDEKSCNFAISVDLKTNETWISAKERAETSKSFSDTNIKLDDFISPGHTFPLLAKKWWVLERLWHTEASVDLMELAWLKKVAVICEIIKDDWTMARLPDLRIFADKFWLKIISIDDLVEFRKNKI